MPNEASAAAFSWHPKLTPYRITFIVTTGALGVTKAVFISKEEAVGSTTVEWITGVVFALLFQFLGAYECKTRRSAHLDWIFSYDCLNVLTSCRRRSHGTITLARPDDVDTIPAAMAPDGTVVKTHVPIVTAYRVLVSSVVISFGLAKMSCAYLGLSTQTNVLDLVLGVPLALGIYYVGLFEEQKTGAPRQFFDVDYYDRTVYAGAFVAGLIVLLAICGICISWLIFWGWALLHSLHLPSTPTHDIEYWRNAAPLALYTFRRMLIFLSLAMFQIGALPWVILIFELAKPMWSSLFDREVGSHFIYLTFWILEYVACLGFYPYAILLLARLPPVADMPQSDYGDLGVLVKEDEQLARYMQVPMGFLYAFGALVGFYLFFFLLCGPFMILGYHAEYNERRRVEFHTRNVAGTRTTISV